MIRLEKEERDLNYRHAKKQMDPALAAQCAIDRAEDLVEDIADDQWDEGDRLAPPSRDESESTGKALPMGRREWIVDSGSSFDTFSPYNLSRKRTRRACTRFPIQWP